MDWLKEILKDVEGKDEIIKTIKSKIGENFVSKSDFNEKNEALKEAKKQIGERDTQLEKLKFTYSNYDDLKGQIESLQAENKAKDDEFKKETLRLQIDNAINLAIRDKVYDEGIVNSLIDREKLVLHEGKVIGLDEQINSIKENKSFLFKSDDGNKFKGIGGNTEPTNPINKNPKDMSYDDFLALEENN